MNNKINLEKCDNFELTEIANSTLAEASGYFFHMYMEEFKKAEPDKGILNKHKMDFFRVGSLQQDGIGNLDRDTLIKRINEYSEYGIKFKKLSHGK